MMRHMLMGSMHGGAMHGGMASFMMFHLLRRMVMKLVLFALVGAVIVLWLRWRGERLRNRGPW